MTTREPSVTEPTTAAGPDSKAGRAMLDMLYNPDCSWSERMVIRAILAIEAEARQQDTSALRTALVMLVAAARDTDHNMRDVDTGACLDCGHGPVGHEDGDCGMAGLEVAINEARTALPPSASEDAHD